MTPNAQQRIDRLIFDLFGVILAFDGRLVYERIAQRCSKPREAAHRLLNLVSDPDLIRGRTPLPQLHSRLVAELGLRAPVQEFHAMWTASHSEPMPGMRALLRDLAGRCRLLLLSNVDRDYWPTTLQGFLELDTFIARVLPFQQRVAEPEAEAFHRAVAASDCVMQHCHFVDDKTKNIDAAASHGLAGHAVQNAASLRSALRQLRLPDRSTFGDAGSGLPTLPAPTPG